jgi:hypothetical protein
MSATVFRRKLASQLDVAKGTITKYIKLSIELGLLHSKANYVHHADGTATQCANTYTFNLAAFGLHKSKAEDKKREVKRNKIERKKTFDKIDTSSLCYKKKQAQQTAKNQHEVIAKNTDNMINDDYVKPAEGAGRKAALAIMKQMRIKT